MIKAFLWTGHFVQEEAQEWFIDALEKGTAELWKKADDTCELLIQTLEGTMTANQGDYIIKGLQGELYPCKPNIFEATYEVVE